MLFRGDSYFRKKKTFRTQRLHVYAIYLITVGASIERLIIQNNESQGEDESMEIFDYVGNQHGDHLPNETVRQMYNASAEEIR